MEKFWCKVNLNVTCHAFLLEHRSIPVNWYFSSMSDASMHPSVNAVDLRFRWNVMICESGLLTRWRKVSGV